MTNSTEKTATEIIAENKKARLNDRIRKIAAREIRDVSEVFVWVLTCQDEGVYMAVSKAAAKRLYEQAIAENAIALDGDRKHGNTGLENWTRRADGQLLYIN